MKLKDILINMILVVCSTAVSLYAIEFYLNIEEYQIELGTTERIRQAAQKQKANWDSRDKVEVIRDLRATGVNAVPAMAPSVLIGENGLPFGDKRIFPFGGLPQTTNVFCNEMGKWSIYQSDEYGFNNPLGTWKKPIDIAFVGDSFTHGACLLPGDDIAAQVRRTGLNTLNLGIGGAGPLIYLGVLKEYVRPVKPKMVFWMHYAVDIRDPLDEVRSPILLNYLEKNETQGLFIQNEQVNAVLKQYYEKGYEEKLMEFANLRQARRKIITARMIHNGIRLKKLRERIALLGTRPEVKEGREEWKLDILQRILVEAKRETESWGGQFVFVFLPDWYTYSSKYDTYGIKIDDNFLLRKDVLAMVHKLNIPLVDIQAEVFDPHKDPVSLYNFRMYGHYTLEGYTMVSDKIKEFLRGKLPFRVASEQTAPAKTRTN